MKYISIFKKYVCTYIIRTLNEKLLTKLVGVHISSVLNELLFNNCFIFFISYINFIIRFLGFNSWICALGNRTLKTI